VNWLIYPTFTVGALRIEFTIQDLTPFTHSFTHLPGLDPIYRFVRLKIHKTVIKN